MFSTQFTTSRPFGEPWFERALTACGVKSIPLRWVWEVGLIFETLRSNDMLRQGRRGVGFGVGSEPMPRVFADLGATITATDLFSDEWIDTHAKFDRDKSGIDCRVVDMNWLNGESGKQAVETIAYDFSWSKCSMDHCGSSWLTKRFLLNTMAILKPGGITVHTAEYTICSGMPIEGGTVWLRWNDIEDLERIATTLGYDFAPIDWFLGDSRLDHMINPPDTGTHLKAGAYEGRWGTSVLFAIKKREDDTRDPIFLPVFESKARAMIAEFVTPDSYQFNT